MHITAKHAATERTAEVATCILCGLEYTRRAYSSLKDGVCRGCGHRLVTPDCLGSRLQRFRPFDAMPAR